MLMIKSTSCQFILAPEIRWKNILKNILKNNLKNNLKNKLKHIMKNISIKQEEIHEQNIKSDKNNVNNPKNILSRIE